MLAGLVVICSFISQAEESATQTADDNLQTAYISDDLFIYMHAGPGNNYRILGSINSGEEVKLTGQASNDYTQIIDNKGRSTWVESKYVSEKPGLRVIIAELNAKLADSEDNSTQVSDELTQANNEISQLNEQTEQLNQKITTLTRELATTQSKLSNQDLDLKKEYCFNGAIVLGIGLLLGLILPRLSLRKKSNMDNWK